MTTEFASSFANILQCLQVARRHLDRVKSTDDECVIPTDLFDGISSADSWLSASAKQAMAHLQRGTEVKWSESASSAFTEYMRFSAAQMQFLAAFLRTSDEDVRLSTVSSGESKNSELEVSGTWISSCQQVLAGLIENGSIDLAMSCMSPDVFAMRFTDTQTGQMTSMLGREASTCAFIYSFVSLQVYLLAKIMNDPTGNVNTTAKASLSLVVNHVASIVEKCMHESVNTKPGHA